MGMISRLLRREILTDGEIDLVKVMDIKAADAGDGIPSVVFEIRRHGSLTAIGRCDLRLGMNEGLYYAGQVGYTVYPPYRGHHTALKACRILFQLAREKYGMSSLIITCNPDNLPSRRTLEHLGGTLKEIVRIPQDHYLVRYGDVEKCIFEFQL